MGAKLKKISFRYFVNTKLKESWDGLFPLYVRINYNKTNTQFPYSFMGGIPAYSSQSDFESHDLNFLDEILGIRDFEEMVTKTIRYKEKLHKGEMGIKGFSEEILRLQNPISEVLFNKIIDDLNLCKMPSGEYLSVNTSEHIYLSMSDIITSLKEKHPGFDSFIESKTVEKIMAFGLLEVYSKHVNKEILCFDWIIDQKREDFREVFSKCLSEGKQSLFDLVGVLVTEKSSHTDLSYLFDYKLDYSLLHICISIIDREVLKG